MLSRVFVTQSRCSFAGASVSSLPRPIVIDPKAEEEARLAEERLNEAMRKVETAQKTADEIDKKLQEFLPSGIRRGSVLAAIKEFENRAKMQNIYDQQSKAAEEMQKLQLEMELAREAFRRAQEARQRAIDEQLAEEARLAEEAARLQEWYKQRRINRSLAAALERDAKKRAEFEAAAMQAERKQRELEERRAKRRQQQMLELAEQVQQRQALEAEQRRIRALMESEESDADGGKEGTDPSRMLRFKQMQDELNGKLDIDRQHNNKRRMADNIADAELATLIKDVQEAERNLQRVQEKIENELKAEGVELENDIAPEIAAVTEALAREREAAEQARKREEARIVQLAKELADIERTRLDFERESSEAAAERARRRSKHEEDMKKMREMEREAQRVAEERMRAAMEEKRRRQAQEEAAMMEDEGRIREMERVCMAHRVMESLWPQMHCRKPRRGQG